MISKRLGLFTLVAAAMLAATAARAADLSPPPIIVPVEQASGWYLRGDIGFSNQSVGSLYNANYAPYDSVVNIDKAFDAAPFYGIGIGYTVNNWLRFDVTGEYRAAANFHGLDVGHFGTSSIDDRYTASKSEMTFLFNGYLDLGTWSNFTPFVGGGIGMSRNTISNFGDVSVCTNSASCATSGGADAYGGTASKWNLAWAIYAGVGYKVTRNFTIELAYRYLDLGNAQSGDLIGFDGTNNSYNPMEFNHLTSQDVKLGLRFNLDNFMEPARPVYYTPPPPLRSRG